MNNRFKFRVWDKIKKRYYNGTNLNLNDYEEVYSDPAGIFFTGLHFLQKDENQYIIQQYTGLNDKNGKEVYEGDIVKFKDLYASTNGQELIGAIIFNKAAFWAQVKGNYFYFDTEPEVIGNIFENPEILK